MTPTPFTAEEMPQVLVWLHGLAPPEFYLPSSEDTLDRARIAATLESLAAENAALREDKRKLLEASFRRALPTCKCGRFYAKVRCPENPDGCWEWTA